MVFTNLSPFPYGMSAFTNISPLTFRDASTFLEYLETIRDYLNETLVPDTNAMIDNAITEFQTGITNAENTIAAHNMEWDAKWQSFKDNISIEIAAISDSAMGDLVLSEISETYAAITALVETKSISPTELNTALTAYATTTALAAKISATEKGAANGVATLGADGKVPAGQLPAQPPSNLTGTLAGRPAANTVTSGTVYYATDVQETYRSNNVAWSVVGTGGNELGFASTVGVPMTSTTSTTGLDVPGLTVSFVAGNRPVDIRLECQLACGTVGYSAYALIALDNQVKRTLPHFASTADVWDTVTGSARISGLVPGQTYVASVGVKTDAPGTARFGSDAFLTVVNR